jgi:peptide/nickel transport system substrate-binding protein
VNWFHKLTIVALVTILLAAACAPGTAVDQGPELEGVRVETAAETAGDVTAETAAEQPTEVPVAEEAAPTQGGVLIRAMTSEPGQIDPQGPPSSGLSLVLPYLFDTLVVRDLDNSVHPLLAESWEVADDGLSVTLKLKEGVTFQDGEPLNAAAVVFTFERFKEVGMASPIYGSVMQIESVEAVDDLRVRFTFAEPAANFWSTLSMPYAGIISPASAERVAEAGEGNLVGTGPFLLESWEVGQQLVLARNPDYTWGPDIVENQGPPYLDKFIYKVIPDAATQLAAMQSGEVDVIFVNQPNHRMQLEAMEGVQMEDALMSSLIYLGFNCQKAPFDEVLVRQALSQAVNKQEILDLALGGLGEVAFAPLPPGLPGFDPGLKEYELGYDPQAAEALLAEAGFVKTDAGTWERDGQDLQATLLTSTRPPNESIATLLQSQLKAIGVAVEIQQLDSKAVMDATTEGAFDLLLWRYDWNDPDALYIFLSSDRIGRSNRVAYSDPDVDALLVAGGRELDEAARVDLYVEAQKLILNDAPWQPLYNPMDVMAISDRVQGVKIGYMGRMLLNDAYVAAER